MSPDFQVAWQEIIWNESNARTLFSLSIEFVTVYSLLVGLMNDLVTHALMIVISLFCGLADNCTLAMNLSVFRAAFEDANF